jgi:NAD(P)-dependent dehydrogenase (short-subunit alcohol dehydrogenase family)
MPGLLDGKVAIVTGAGHGVGRGYALALAAAGAKVVVNDLGGSVHGEGADPRDADIVADIVNARGGQAVANHENVADFDGAGRMVQQAIDTFGKLDVLVLNAGIVRDRMIFNMAEADWDAVVDVHLKGHFAPAHHACAHWRERSKALGGAPVDASVVCTTSIAGLEGNTGQTNYVAAKAGIAMFAVALSQDMVRYGVRANTIAPSGATRIIATVPGREAAEAPKEPDEYTAWDTSNPGLVAPLCVWLASDLSRHVAGQIFLSSGPRVTHYHSFTAGESVTVPGGNREWSPEELADAMDTVVLRTRHAGLRRGLQFKGQ